MVALKRWYRPHPEEAQFAIAVRTECSPHGTEPLYG